MDNNNNSNNNSNNSPNINCEERLPIAQPINQESDGKNECFIPQAIPFTSEGHLETSNLMSPSAPPIEVIRQTNQIHQTITQEFQALPNGLLIPVISSVNNVRSEGNCRDCGRKFIRDEVNRGSSSYYRCEECRKDFFTRNLIASCLIS